MALILVVEDEALIRINAEDMIEAAGHVWLEANNADTAIKILEEHQDIDVVFSDINMPGTVDGQRLMQIITKRWPPIRLILTSGKVTKADAALPNDCLFLSKPYTQEQLLAAIANVLDQAVEQ